MFLLLLLRKLRIEKETGQTEAFFVALRHDTKEKKKGILSHDSGGEGGGLLVVGISCHQFPSW